MLSLSMSFCSRCGANRTREVAFSKSHGCQACGGRYTASWLTYLIGGIILFLLFDTANIPWSGLFAGIVMFTVPVAAVRQQWLLSRTRRNPP
jgi:hypothetical protein